MRKTVENFSKVVLFAFLMAAVPLASSFAAVKDAKGVVDPKKCGGTDQPTCKKSAATFLGKAKLKKPHKKAFFSLRKGGEWWKCPDNRPRRTLKKVNGKKACATKKLIGAKHSKAEFLGKVKTKKPHKDAFRSLRKGGQWWVCPGGFFRNPLTKVNGKSACRADLGRICDKGNVRAGNLFVGFRCYKKKVCGNKNQRPCNITERFPACKKGLAKDFLVDKCIPRALALCLTVVRGARFATKGAKKLSGIQGEAQKIVNEAVNRVLSTLPGFNLAMKEVKKVVKKATKPIQKATKKVMKKQGKEFIQVLAMAGEINDTVTKNKKKIAKLMTSDKLCTMKEKDIKSTIKSLLGPKAIKFAGLSQPAPGMFDGLFVKSAHAGLTDNLGFVTLGGSFNKIISPKALKGASITLGIDIELAGGKNKETKKFEGGVLIGISSGITSFDNPGREMNVHFGIQKATSFRDLTGIGIDAGFAINASKKIRKKEKEKMHNDFADKLRMALWHEFLDDPKYAKMGTSFPAYNATIEKQFPLAHKKFESRLNLFSVGLETNWDIPLDIETAKKFKIKLDWPQWSGIQITPGNADGDSRGDVGVALSYTAALRFFPSVKPYFWPN